MNGNTPLITVIVPIYNTANFLRKCVDSLLNQSYGNIEILLMDDGSTDDSGRICDKYADMDSRVAVIHNENQGVARTRNMGIDKARGEYIMFVDSDDWVDRDMCSVLIEAVSRYQTQAAMCSYIREYPDKLLPKEIVQQDTVFGSRDFQRMLCGPVGVELNKPENIECFNSVWGKIYPASAIKELSIIDTRIVGTSEDLLFNLEAFANIENIVCINKPMYHYRKSVDQSITAQYKPDMDKQWNNLYAEIQRVIASSGLDEVCHVALRNRIALNTLGLSFNCVIGDAGCAEKCRRIGSILSDPRRKDALQKLPLNQMPIYWKVFYFCAKNGLAWALYILINIINKLKGKV